MKKTPLSKLQKDVLKLIAEIREERKRNTMHYKLLEALKKMNWKEVATRALWTFVQTFIAVFILAGDSIIDLLFKADWANLWTLLIATGVAAVAAGLSAVKTIVLEVIRQLKASE